MHAEFKSSRRIQYGVYEGFETRCRRRLQEDLGMDDTAAEAILHLRSQIIELQNQIRQMQIELAAHTAGQELRLSSYKNVSIEAAWVEMDNQQ